MSRLTDKRKINKNVVKTIFGISLIFFIIFSVMIISEIYNDKESLNFKEDILPFIIFNLPFFVIFLSLSLKKIGFNKNDKDIFIIVISYLKYLQLSKNKILEGIKTIFHSHPDKDINDLFQKYINEETTIFGSCNNLSTKEPEIRYYAIFSLYDLAAKDNLLSLVEEEFIQEISNRLRISRQTYQFIKNAYIKQGLQEERKIIEEQNRKKIVESFLPFNAYKILGVTPNVSKIELKKIYRKLAKKYHPDKHYKQSEEIIQKMEEKFEEITKAYEIIKKHKNYQNEQH